MERSHFAVPDSPALVSQAAKFNESNYFDWLSADRRRRVGGLKKNRGQSDILPQICELRYLLMQVN